MEPTDEDRQRAERMFADLEGAASKLGLYLQHGTVAPLPGEEEDVQYPETVAVYAQFSIGDRAWTTQVQDPEQHKFDESFREIRMDAEDEEFRQARENLQRLADEDGDG